MGKKYLYVVLTRPNTIISKIIRFIKKDEYTHAAISLDKDLEEMYSFGRKHTFNPFIGKFKKEHLNKGIYRLCRKLPGIILEIEVSEEQYAKAKALIEHFIVHDSYYKYNYRGLIDSILNKEACYHNRFLCSEFVYHVLKESGIVNLGISRNLIRPQNFLALKSNIIYKGDLKEIIETDSLWNIEKLKASIWGIIFE
ncbi:hypothetical protein [Lutispora thermophila]|uniref:Permuted papain-like amidase enzyme, YaeF/YiiX, C92 family n=1 Tax=Lutispora thermophila DSM 19022 TaxID=1122184 RepID=A0A1M6B2U8_9FIRM|nr:hypothetical protein [Lutispora thermophila]SHI43072.1 hypothetical protein SAMN02745176_00243 [Lutispora thermophila DSM 19022]